MSAPAPAPETGLPDEPPLPPMGTVGLLRWMWRQLTSMRTALILLFLLAIASIPGSVLPQRGTNPLKVDAYLQANPTTGPVLDRLGFFEVYSSPWFSAVYLLLFVSLIGCVLPRIAQHLRALRTPPPPAPRAMDRMAVHRAWVETASAEDVRDRARRLLPGWRLREGVDGESVWIAAEKGYLRETGNLVFHLALVVILLAVAFGGLFGWKGNVIVRAGTGFSNTLTQYDAWGAGRFVDANDLAPFSFTLDSFTVDFERGDAQRGAPREFTADVTYRSEPGAKPEKTTIEVNHPLDVSGAKVFLVGHGYAPHIIVRDSTGAVVFDDTVVFLPQDGNFTSTGVIKVPDASPSLGFNGLFLPTAAQDATGRGISLFPAPDNPEVLLAAFRGNLGLDSGVPQSVYTLDTTDMVKVGLESLAPGQTWTLPNNSGSIEFAGLDRWASFQVAHDPGKEVALAAAVLAILGLMMSLFVQRRRIWVKATPGPAGTLVQVAGLAKNQSVDLTDEVAVLAARLGESTEGRQDDPIEERSAP